MGSDVSELIVTDVAIFAFLIMIAAVIVVSRGRRGSGRRSRPRGTAAEPASAGMDPRDTPITPGLREEAVEPDSGAHQPAEPEPAEPEPTASEQAEPEQAEPEQAEPEQAEPEQAEPEQAEPEQAEPSQVSEVTAPEPGPDDSAAEPAGHQDGAEAIAGNGQIGSYYEGADQPIADYLAERGWPEEPGTHDPAGRASQD